MPAAALQNIDKEDDSAERKDDFGAADYRRTLELKADHTSRPLWIVCFISYAIYYFMDFIGSFLICVMMHIRLAG